MAKATNSFVTGKMNKDRDDRLLQANEYRNAMNAQVSRSEGANVGALENVLGNSLISDFRALTTFSDIVSIGYCSDEINNRVFVFLTNNTSSNLSYNTTQKNFIVVYNALTESSTILVKGNFLNFSTAFPITGANILEDLLYFTDNRNQPRVINVTLAATSQSYYTIEEQISVAKYNPYQSIELYKESSISNEYETTMYDVVSLYYPNGGYGDLNADVLVNATTLLIKKEGFEGDICIGVTVGVRNKSTGVISDTGTTVSSSVSSAAYWTVAVVGGNLPAISASTEEIVFSFNQYYNPDYNGDKDYLRDRFVRFAYRYKFIDGEYSIMSPFTQECFIPKQDGYFMRKVNQPNAAGVFPVPNSPPLDIQDEEDAYRSTVVEFMQNKVNKIILRIPMPYNSALMETKLKVTDIDILFKESDSNTINVIESVSIARVQAQATSGTVYEYEYQSTKPYKVLPSSETTRTYDKVPVRALSQEVISNRIVYGNFEDKHTPPSNIDYNVAVSPKSTFNLGGGTTTVSVQAASGSIDIDINTVAGVIQNGFIITSNVVGAIPSGSIVGNFNSTNVKLTLATTAILPVGSVLTFTSPNSVIYTTSKVEYPNSSLKQNRNYQVGVVLSDKFGRSSTVILSESDSSTQFNNEQYVGSTVFSDYINNNITADTFPGNSLKVLFNNPIPGGSTGIYNGDIASVDYNPLGWYSYKIVVKQTEQEYYNVYLPGIMAAYPTDATKELGKTSHTVLISDNINKVPRDLTEVGPEQKQFRSNINLHGRVENLPSTVNNLNNIQYYPGPISPIVSVIGTDRDLFDGIPTDNYVGSAEFYNVVSNPLVARINTPSKKIGVTAVITTATVASSQTGAAPLDQLNIDISTISPIYSASGQLVPSGSIVAGQSVSGPGVPVGTIVNSATTNNQTTPVTFKITFNQNLEGTSVGDVLTFSPTQQGPVDGPFITMPQLAVMETDGVNSNLDIFWETTSEGLITELNQAILGGTADAVSISGFNTNVFTEALAVNNNIAANFTLKDQFGNDISYVATTPAQLQLHSVTDYNGDDVSSTFSLVRNGNNYNVELEDYLYFSNQNATKQTYSFTFEVNYSSNPGTEPVIQSFITQQPVSLINVIPTFAQPANVTYIPGTDGGGNGTITNVQAQNGANTDISANIAWKDISWSLTVTKDGVNYGPSGTGNVLINQSRVNAFWNGHVFFSGSNPPNSMVDGTYLCTATITDAGGLSQSRTFNLIINRTPCYSYKFTYGGTGNIISGLFTTCQGINEGTVSFVDPPTNTFPGYAVVCARDTTYTGTNLPSSFNKLDLDANDPANTCNV
jgi:hypothetical protein